MTYIIRQGDPTSTGGVVTQGHPLLTVFDKPATLEGMIATCLVCKKGYGPIRAIGSRQANIDGILVAIQGDHVLCACPPGTNVVQATQFEATVVD